MMPTVISSVVVAAQPPAGQKALDLVTLADVKLELGITDTKNDAWLGKTISRVSLSIEKYCNRVFAVQTYEDKIWGYRDPYPWQLPGGLQKLQLCAWPLAIEPSTAGIAPPAAPALTQVVGGALPAAKLVVRVSYVTLSGETAAGVRSDLSVGSGALLSVASPPFDPKGLATGWNVYAGMLGGSETLQNSTPISIGDSWVQPETGLIKGSEVPPFLLVVEDFDGQPKPLAEGKQFIADRELGQLSRTHQDGLIVRWSSIPVRVRYPAGFAEIPDDLQDAVIRMVKARWFGRDRDPLVRSQTAVGIYEAQYFFGAGPGSEGQFPPDVTAMLDNYRVPVIA